MASSTTSIEELKDTVKSAFPGYLIDSAYDYGEIVVFNIIPQDYTTNNLESFPLNRNCSINKETKEIKVFNPFDVPEDTFKNGKRII